MAEGSVAASTPAPAAGDSASTGEPATGSETQTAAAPVAADDPEIELDDGVKLKRSELRALHKSRKELDRGANEKFQEAARIRKEAAAELAQAKEIAASMSSDLKAALRKAGKDPIVEAEKILKEALEEYQLSPSEKELRDLKAEKAKREAEDAKRAEDAEKEKHNKEVDSWERTIANGIFNAFKTTGLPADPYLVRRMSFVVEAMLDDGMPVSQATFDEAASHVWDEVYSGNQRVFQSASDEQAEKFYGETGLEKARKLILQKAQAAQTKPQIPNQASAPRKPSSGGLSRADLEARINKRLGA